MCLTSKNYKTRNEQRIAAKNPLVAKKDMKVYKILTLNNLSPFQRFEYEKGFHYYQEGKPFRIKTDNGCSLFWTFYVYEGLHAYINKKKAEFRVDASFSSDYRKVVQMIVPKGSLYYLGSSGDIVSNNLIWR